MAPSDQTNPNILDLFTRSNGSILDLVNYWVWLQKQDRTIPGLDSNPEQDTVTTVQLFNHLLKQCLKTEPLTLAEYQRIVEQALVLIEEVYVHRYLKSALYATNPIEKLKLLQRYVTAKFGQGYTPNNSQAHKLELWFHRSMTSIFRELRDIHTVYLLPTPFQDKIAFLPFQIEECFVGQNEGSRHYIVSKLASITQKNQADSQVTKFVNSADLESKDLKDLKDLEFPNIQEFLDELQASCFKPGVVLVSWNGIPIEQAIELNADRQSGGNEDARLARGIEAMTFRPLSLTLPPEENWVVVRYKQDLTDPQIQECKIPWLVLSPPVKESLRNQYSQETEALIALGVDSKTEENRNLKKKYFRQQTAGDDNYSVNDLVKDNFQGYLVNQNGVKEENGNIGYIRLFSFMLNRRVTVDLFVCEFIKLLENLNKKTKKIIIDVRGNGGGSILVSERLLQVLVLSTRSQSAKPKTAQFNPVRFQFISTPLMQKICQQRQEPNFKKWANSIEQSLTTGELYSKGFHLEFEPEKEESWQREIPQLELENLVLIIDALCYSATDIFAAGFQDNGLGKILGTSCKTGAGGANVWTHGFLQRYFPADSDSPFMLLPKKASFFVAVRRAIRSTGNKLNDPIEDLGVELDMKQDKRYYLQNEDILNTQEGQRNKCMIADAVKLLNSENLPPSSSMTHSSQ